MRRVTAAALLLAAAAGCSTAPAEPASGPSADSTAASDKISWGPCTDIKRPDGEPPARQDASIRCGKLAVPSTTPSPTARRWTWR
ncbi:hypothetical protein ACFQ0B_27835 [Nonomuraea thailandensis]